MRNQIFANALPAHKLSDDAPVMNSLLQILRQGSQTCAQLAAALETSEANVQTYISKARRAGKCIKADRTVKPCVYTLVETEQNSTEEKIPAELLGTYNLVRDHVSKKQFMTVYRALQLTKLMER